MMHYDQYVVAITDQSGKSFREFDPERLSQGRKSKVYIPFDSEYKILIKNNSDRRLKMKIDLDGTSISGLGGLILDAYKTEFLERFVDVARKFKFVRKNDERVSDPSNVENGILKISIEKEIQPYTISTWPPNGTWVYHSNPIVPPDNYWNQNQPMYGVNSMPCGYTTTSLGSDTNIKSLNAVSQPSAYSCKVDNSMSPASCMRSLAPKRTLAKTLLNEESGATVEGAASSQVFTQTTWNGTDGLAYEFIFKLLGQGGVSDAERIEYQKYLDLKKKFEG